MYLYYGFVVLSAVLFSIQFVFTKMYQKERGDSFRETCFFSLFTSLLFGFFMLVLNGFQLHVSAFSILMAFLSAAVNIGCKYCGMIALSSGDLSHYSLFLSLGGMVIPALYGLIFGKDELNVQRMLCFALILVAVFVSKVPERESCQKRKSKRSWRAAFAYSGIFLLNGLISVIAAVHQQNPFGAECVGSEDFTILSMIAAILLSGAFLLSTGRPFRPAMQNPVKPEEGEPPVKQRSFSVRSVLSVVGFGIANGLGNYLLLISIVHIETSVQYSIVTGGCIFLSVLFGLFFKEKITVRKLLSAGLTLAGTLMLIF